jgi:hypothetical protein
MRYENHPKSWEKALVSFAQLIYFDRLIHGKGDASDGVLDWHKGHFGAVNLEVIYPFLNALGSFALLFTGTSLWLHMRRTPKKKTTYTNFL